MDALNTLEGRTVTKARLRQSIAYAADGELIPGTLGVTGNCCHTLPAGLIVDDFGIREDVPPAALIRSPSGGYSWIKANLLQPVD